MHYRSSMLYMRLCTCVSVGVHVCVCKHPDPPPLNNICTPQVFDFIPSEESCSYWFTRTSKQLQSTIRHDAHHKFLSIQHLLDKMEDELHSPTVSETARKLDVKPLQFCSLSEYLSCNDENNDLLLTHHCRFLFWSNVHLIGSGRLSKQP